MRICFRVEQAEQPSVEEQEKEKEKAGMGPFLKMLSKTRTKTPTQTPRRSSTSQRSKTPVEEPKLNVNAILRLLKPADSKPGVSLVARTCNVCCCDVCFGVSGRNEWCNAVREQATPRGSSVRVSAVSCRESTASESSEEAVDRVA
jgi:hypothetical protein